MKLLCLPFYQPENRQREKGRKSRGVLGANVTGWFMKGLSVNFWQLGRQDSRIQPCGTNAGPCTKQVNSCTRHNYSVTLPGLIWSRWEASTAASLLLAGEGQPKYHRSVFFSTGRRPHQSCLPKTKLSIHLCLSLSAVTVQGSERVNIRSQSYI